MAAVSLHVDPVGLQFLLALASVMPLPCARLGMYLDLPSFNRRYPLNGVKFEVFSGEWESLAEEEVTPAWVLLTTWSLEALYLSVCDLNRLLSIFNLLMRELCQVCELAECAAIKQITDSLLYKSMHR